MKIHKAFKYKLKPNSNQSQQLAMFAGCSRFVWNRALALIKYNLVQNNGYLGYISLSDELTCWKQTNETLFLQEPSSYPLQQKLIDLDRACKDAFKKNKAFPKFKKKGTSDSFRYSQDIKICNYKVFLPKIGWVKFQKSREIEGIIKNTTVSKKTGKWYVSFQTEYEIDNPVHPSKSHVGIDLGVSKFATLSNNTIYKPVNSFKTLEPKLAKRQRKLSRQIKFSNNWKKQKAKVARIYAKMNDIRKDMQHKISTEISKNHAMIVVEDLKVKTMSNSKIKSLNKSILDQGWYEFVRQLEYKQLWSGGKLVKIDPKYTSQKCSKCGHITKENRKSQSNFKCVSCGHKSNADLNASINILAAGQAVLACRDIKKVAS